MPIGDCQGRSLDPDRNDKLYKISSRGHRIAEFHRASNSAGGVGQNCASPRDKPLILQVGFHVLYQQAHIPQAEYIGAASGAEGFSSFANGLLLAALQPSCLLRCCP